MESSRIYCDCEPIFSIVHIQVGHLSITEHSNAIHDQDITGGHEEAHAYGHIE